MALMWRVSRHTYQLEDLDILAPGALYGHAAPAAAVVPSPKAASSSGVKRLKVSNFGGPIGRHGGGHGFKIGD